MGDRPTQGTELTETSSGSDVKHHYDNSKTMKKECMSKRKKIQNKWPVCKESGVR